MTTQLENTRNIGIVAHVDAGKTTTTERVLFYAGNTYKIGDVDDGNTVTDHMAQERERGITIVSAAVTVPWGGHTINLIDTPGHVDFTMEVERSMRVLDGVVVVICAKGGVQPQTRTVWGQANRHHVPRLIFVNKVDTLGADFNRVLEQIGSELSAKPAVLSIPMGQSDEFAGVIDLLSMKALVWDESDPSGARFESVEIPEAFLASAREHRARLVEAIAETNDELTEKFLMEEPISESELRAALRQATLSMSLTPVLVGSAKMKRGIQPLMDAVVDYLPSPLDVKAVKGELPDGSEGERNPSPDEPLAALVFKVVSDPHGFLFYVRVYAGVLRAGSRVYNSTRGAYERVSRLVKMQGAKRTEVSELAAGDIGVCLALKSSQTGDTLTDDRHPIVLEKIVSPEPVISQAIEAKDREADKRLALALDRLAKEDPSFRYGTNPETGQTVISGMGELHLEVKVELMRAEDKVEVSVGEPVVSYRETPGANATAVGELKKQTGGKGMFAVAEIELEPLPRGTGFEFVDAVVGGAIPRPFIASVEKGVRAALASGTLTGSPVIDLRVTLVDGKFHAVDSNDMAFQVAGEEAFKAAFTRCHPTLLEPLMKLTVEVPESYTGAVIGDLLRRRGKVEGTDMVAGKSIIQGLVPLGETFGYASAIRNATQGQGIFNLTFERYEPVPQDKAEVVIAEARK